MIKILQSNSIEDLEHKMNLLCNSNRERYVPQGNIVVTPYIEHVTLSHNVKGEQVRLYTNKMLYTQTMILSEVFNKKYT